LAGLANVQVVRLDARDIEAVKALLPAPDAIFVDIGGTALLDNVAFVLRQCLGAFKPRLIVVRSSELAEVVSRVREVLPPKTTRRQFAGEDALEGLLKLSRSSRVSSRLFALRHLRKHDDARARDRLAQMAHDPSPRIRKAALGRPQ
jgi:hypothetical protein